MAYPRHRDDQSVVAAPSFPQLENQVLDHWDADGTFQASIDARPAGDNGANEFVFYDGPPFANGLPHYGHLLTGYVKDLVPRYQTMRGKHVERRFGWDTHGLPAEVETEKQLGITTKAEILRLGIEKFNTATKESVLRYTHEWERYVRRQARWVDFENDYKTLDLPFMESVMWAFKQLHDKGLIYEGFKVLPYCWRCETPLSNNEIRMDDTYRDRQDPAATVWVELVDTGERLLTWTTMPWTWVPNSNLVVDPEVDYAVVELDGHRYVIAKARLAAYEKELGAATLVDTVKGSVFVGRKYKPVFDFLVEAYADVPAAFTVLAGDFVSTEDGTGLVEVGPAHGEDDFNITTAAGVPTILTVDDRTRFTSIAPRFEGLQVFEANRPILRELRERGLLLREESYVHSYPHCWRCDTPLVYKALSSWFVSVTKFKARASELNQQITWTPAHVKDGSFGKWLENAIDWPISRNRFWGSPIPVWKSDSEEYPRVDVYGSLDQLEADFGVRLEDLHRPGIDELTRPNPDDPTGKSTMRRVPEVLDCWFESGSMPFAQVHYPFENAEWFEHHFPGDFIVEYIGQTRAWFYFMQVIATALFDRPAFLTAISHGIVLGDDGKKMSKSLRNYPDVYEMFDTYGSDAMRWSLMSSPILRGGDMSVSEPVIRDAVRQAINPLWNAWYFFSLYANAAKYEAKWRTDSRHVLDRYVLAKLSDAVESVTESLDVYDISGACASVRSFLDVLTNWYVRRSRDRFWNEDTDAFDTLYTVLEVLTRVAAPLLPMVTEEVWRGLTGGRSVHLQDWPEASALPSDAALVASMDEVRAVCSAALSLRKARKLRVRLPLASLTVAVADAQALEPFIDLIADEVNVKEVRLTTDVEGYCQRVLSLVPRVLGPRLGKDVQKVIKAVKAGDWSVSGGLVTAGGVELTEGEYDLRLVPTDADSSAPLPGDAGVVVLDVKVTPELAAEGLAKDVIRAVQQARRDAGLDVADRIHLTLEPSSDDVRAAVEAHHELVTAETLAASLTFGTLSGDVPATELADGHSVRVAVAKA
ncbi:isoleucine--tRNA ligase [Fodinicola acaciae]|uniref:isoleucine--tRNA ligase n=1 Tax=Fodinicola acaciae TaxID=2681555 RepID=UPI0013D0D77B|nr:isoleucine--tRNA ligase [Fodinicola acaciae]